MCREHLLCAEGCPATQTGRAGVDKDQEILKHWFSHSLEKCQRSSNTRVAGELHTRQALITQAWCNFSCHVAHLLLFFFFYFQRVTLNHGCWKIVSRLFFWFTWCRFLSMRAEQVSGGADRSCGMGTESGSWCWHLHSTCLQQEQQKRIRVTLTIKLITDFTNILWSLGPILCLL